MSEWDWIATVALLIVLPLGAYALMLQRRVAGLEAKRRKEEAEHSKVADVRVTLRTTQIEIVDADRTVTYPHHHLQIDNRGPAVAKDVNLRIFPEWEPGSAGFLVPNADSELPIRMLAANDYCQLMAATDMTDKGPCAYELTWHDDRGFQRREGRLTVVRSVWTHGHGQGA